MREFQGQAVLRLAVHDYAKVFVAGRLAGSISRNEAVRAGAAVQEVVLAVPEGVVADDEGQVLAASV